MIATFFDGLDELYCHTKFGKDRIYTTRAGCRCENMVFVRFTGRMPQNDKLTILNLLSPKIKFFAQQGRLLAPIHVKLGTGDGHVGPLGCAKFHLNRRRGWACGPKIYKNFHFLVKSRLAGANPLTDF